MERVCQELREATNRTNIPIHRLMVVVVVVIFWSSLVRGYCQTALTKVIRIVRLIRKGRNINRVNEWLSWVLERITCIISSNEKGRLGRLF